MKTRIIAVAALAACSVCATSNAEMLGEAHVYGSHIKLDDGAGFQPSGNGFGARAKLPLPLTGLFASAEYQRNNTSGSGTDLKITSGRVGVGDEISLGVVSAQLRGEYVHLRGETSGGSDNDDGFGVHAGVDAGIGVAGVYGSVGYLKLADDKGPELMAGARFSIFPLLSLFGELRHSKLKDSTGGGGELTVNDYHVGVRFSF